MRRATALMTLVLCGWALAQSVTVTAPVGGEQWQATTVNNITWTSSGEARDSINYSTDNGANWLLVDTVPSPLQLYAWTVPNTPSGSSAHTATTPRSA